MTNSSFKMPPQIVSNIAEGYYYKDGTYKAFDKYVFPNIASGGFNTTGADIANFMIAQLQNGEFNGNRILSDKSAIDMHTQHFTTDKMLPGICYSFFENNINGLRVINHGGSVPGFTSGLYIIPDKNIGFFISLNAEAYASDASKLLDDYEYGFVNHYYPSAVMAVNTFKENTTAENNLKKFEGTYRINRLSLNSYSKLQALISNMEYDVKVNNSRLYVKLNGKYEPFEQIGPDEFKIENGDFKIAFREGVGKADYMFFADLVSLNRISLFETRTFQFIFIAIISIILLVSIITGLSLVFKNRKKQESKDIKTLRISYLVSSIVSAAFILNIGTYATNLNLAQLEINLKSTAMIILLTIPLICLIIFVISLWKFIVCFKRKQLKLLSKFYYILISLCQIGFILLLNYWCLLGYRF